MPYKRKPGYRQSKRKAKRYVRKGIPKMSIVKSIGGIANSLRTRLAYTINTYGTLNAVNVVDHQFRANSLFDFDYANNFGNVQPQGRDRLAQLYQKYLVRYVTVIAEIAVNGDTYQTGGTTASKSAAGICFNFSKWLPDVNSAAPSVPGNVPGLPGSLCRMICAGQSRRIVWKLPLYKMYAVRGVNPMNTEYAAQSDSNPTAPVWAHVRLEAPDATSTSTIDYSVNWKILFDVEYAGPKISTIDTT